jgi:hypothetical protein
MYTETHRARVPASGLLAGPKPAAGNRKRPTFRRRQEVSMSVRQQVRTSQSLATDSRQAVREFHASVAQPHTELVVFFCSSEHDLDALAEEMCRSFAGTAVVGCTTAGEIGPSGYTKHSLSGASFPADAGSAVIGHIGSLKQFGLLQAQTFVQDLLQRLEAREPSADPQNSFAFLLIDGMSVREEQVTHALQNAFGGSAGDDLRFVRTHVYYNGRFHADSAVLVLVTTSLPFKVFKTQHFVSGDERLVVTAADPATRTVKEINGLPAAREYARLVGVSVRDLDPTRFAAWPVVVVLDGTDYVRSIQKANPDGSLTFYCAIDEGLVLRVARGVDLVQNLQQTFDRIHAEIGPPQLVFGCDCILRSLEISQSGLKASVEEILRRNNTVGFNTYGEQSRGVHVNQTLTGIAIGTSPAEAPDA